MMGKRIFLTYATPDFAENRDSLAKSAARHGFDDVRALGPADLSQTEFWSRNLDTLSQKRGAGYWLWKPYIIQQVLQQMSADDILLYCDAGRSRYYEFTRQPRALLELARQTGFLTGVSVPQHGPTRKWAKRDCLILMGADDPAYWERPTIQATWSVWTRTAKAEKFVEEWLRYAEDPRCLTDMDNTLGQPNHDGFSDHRHDQTISTLLTYRTGAPFLDISNSAYDHMLALRPQSRLAHLFLKSPQDGDSVAAGRSAPVTLASAQWRLWRTG